MNRPFRPVLHDQTRRQGHRLGAFHRYAIVTSSAGGSRWKAPSGNGSTFNLFIPALEEEPTNARPQRTCIGHYGPAPCAAANERVLLVEDDAFIRSMLTRFLQREGYRLTAAMDGPSALEVWAAAQASSIC